MKKQLSRELTLPVRAGERPFTLDADSLKESFTVLAKKLAGKWNRGAVDSQLASFDKETGIYTYSEAKAGSSLNEDELVQSLMEAVKAGTYDTAVIPEFTEISPKRTAAQAKEQYQVIGSFTTKTTNNKNRNENIRLAVEAIDGRQGISACRCISEWSAD